MTDVLEQILEIHLLLVKLRATAATPSEVTLANSSDLCSASAWLLARCTTMGQE